MSDKEKKAINLLKVLKLSFKRSKPYKFTYTLANGNEYTDTEIVDIFDIVLNLIQKQEKVIDENEKQLQNIREEFLKYDWKNSNSKQIYNQLKSLYESIYRKVEEDGTYM